MPLRTEWIRLDPRSVDPASPVNGDIWYNDTGGRILRREGGVTVSVGAGPSVDVNSVSPVNTTSPSDVLMSGMTITPLAGIYFVAFSSLVNGSTGVVAVFTSIYTGGVQAPPTERSMTGIVPASLTSIGRVTVNGSQAIEGRWRVSSGTGTVTSRCLLIMAVA